MHLHYAFFEDAAPLGIERLIVFPPKYGLSEPRRGSVVKPDDFRCRNHYRIRIAVLLHGHQEGPADIGPGYAEKVAASGYDTRHVAQCHQFGTMMYRWSADAD